MRLRGSLSQAMIPLKLRTPFATSPQSHFSPRPKGEGSGVRGEVTSDQSFQPFIFNLFTLARRVRRWSFVDKGCD